MKKRILSILTALTIMVTSADLEKTNDSKHNNLQDKSSSIMYLNECEESLPKSILFGELPKFYKKQFKDYDISLNEQHILNIDMNNADDFSWIAECESLEWLTLNIIEDIDIEKLTYLSNLKSLYRLDINFAYQLDYGELINFILNSNIKELCIKFERGIFYKSDIDFINEILNSKKLAYFWFESIYANGFSCEADFENNILMITYPDANFSSNALRIPYGYENVLFSKGMNIQIFNEGEECNYLFYYNKINRDYPVANWSKLNYDIFQELIIRFEEIYEKLNIEEKDSDEEKIEKILYYIVQNYSYDYENYLNHTTEKDYEDGRIGNALNDKEIICGNYSAIFQILANRAGLESYIIDGPLQGIQERHSWNIIKLNGNYYLVDPTWIDNLYDLLNCISLDLVDEKFLLQTSYLINQDVCFLKKHVLQEDFTNNIKHNLNVIMPCINIGIYALILEMLKIYQKSQEDNINKRHILQKKK